MVTVVVLIGFQVKPMEATTVENVSLKELTHRSSKVVLGTCLEREFIEEPDDGLVYTEYRFQVDQPLKPVGSPTGIVLFRVLGGTMNGVVSYVPGSPGFSPEDRVVLFLSGPDGLGHARIMGVFQGAFQVEWDDTLGESIREFPRGVRLFEDPEKTGGPGINSPIALEEFLFRVRSYVNSAPESASQK